MRVICMWYRSILSTDITNINLINYCTRRINMTMENRSLRLMKIVLRFEEYWNNSELFKMYLLVFENCFHFVYFLPLNEKKMFFLNGGSLWIRISLGKTVHYFRCRNFIAGKSILKYTRFEEHSHYMLLNTKINLISENVSPDNPVLSYEINK